MNLKFIPIENHFKKNRANPSNLINLCSKSPVFRLFLTPELA